MFLNAADNDFLNIPVSCEQSRGFTFDILFYTKKQKLHPNSSTGTEKHSI